MANISSVEVEHIYSAVVCGSGNIAILIPIRCCSIFSGYCVLDDNMFVHALNGIRVSHTPWIFILMRDKKTVVPEYSHNGV